MYTSSPRVLILLASLCALCITHGTCIYLSRDIDLAAAPFVDLFTFGFQQGGGIELRLIIKELQLYNNTPIYFYICEHDKFTAVCICIRAIANN